MNKNFLIGILTTAIIAPLFSTAFAEQTSGQTAIQTTNQTPDPVETLAHSKYWLRLLHYKPTWPFGKLESQADGPEFFFSANGDTDPKAELEETVKAFSKNIQVGMLKQHPQCAFPERYRFLKKELHLEIEDVACPKVEEFLARFQGQSASLVFSSAYPNNPGSSFGHTFLQIRSKKRPDILDYGISYAAGVADDENGFAYMYLGLMGGYRGSFSMVPYYNKVNEYVNAESRDIWEYDLSLNEEETTRMLTHLWEVETNSWFNYYFFNENCAYELLAALEIAKPDWDLTDRSIFVIPGETVKKLMSIPGAVKNVKFRPSLRKKMMQKFETLSAEQKSEVFELIENKKDVSKITEPSVLESSVTYLQYIKQSNHRILSPEQNKLMKDLLARRSELGPETRAPASDNLPMIAEDSRPDLGHNPSRVGTSAGVFAGNTSGSSARYFQELSFKFAYHDLMNNDLGYVPFSQIDFPNLTLRYIPSTTSLYIENLTAFSVTSLFPLGLLDKKLSWKMQLDYYSPKDFGCVTCHAARFEGGGGATINLFTPKAIAYTLLTADGEVGSSFAKGYRFGPKLQVATILNPIQAYKFRLSGTAFADVAQTDRQVLHYEFNMEQSYAFNQCWEVRFLMDYYVNTTSTFESYRDSKFTLNYYF